MNLTRLSCLAVLVLLLSAGSAVLANTHGMTWGKVAHNSSLGTDKVGCLTCDPYQGDTSCTVALPVLCIRTDGSPNPGISLDYYNGWVGGHIATTRPIGGEDLTSLSRANQFCSSYFGSGWRMAEFHDGNGGWNWNAYGNVRSDTRYWVYIDDQAGNCWD